MAKVILVCGRLCCGKTTYAHELRLKERGVVLSCDELMLSVLDAYLGDQHDVYAARTEAYLLRKSLEMIETGIPVILDWGPWTKAGRERLKAFYAQHGIVMEIHAIRIGEQEWRARITRRNDDVGAGGCQAYHVDEGLLNKFLTRYEELTEDEADLWINA